MKAIYLAFCSDKDLTSLAISLITGKVGPEKYPIIHCEIVLGSEETGYIKYCAKPYQDTYKRECSSLEVYKKWYNYSELYKFYVSDEEYDQLQQFLESQLGKKYDWLAILSLGLFKRNWESSDKWICSEYLITALNKCTSITLLNKRADAFRITPRDLYLSPLVNAESYYNTYYRE